MEHEDPGTSGCRKRDVVGLCLGNLGSVIAESVNFCVQLLKIDGREVLVHQKCHVRRPGKAEECGTLPDPVMVSGNDDNSGPGDRPLSRGPAAGGGTDRRRSEGDRRGSLSRPQ